jgi:hypothetical protein
MTDQRKDEGSSHPTVREHPEQRRQEETGHEDASEVNEVGQPTSKEPSPRKAENAA